ncbi:hypothetical protein TSOC_001507 [Tetrabaena socialis]|uniref:Uncharacterized protein n=1 Tax=Tetrabaena socialis TaxID=47790 RepID=A0A2J8AGK2_9CHLO|nr:hypothetical protein TSOC_001507 [Tetrabaena socialis]|eukprot:PNH11641.1 hypothetical protein TSOC_001507 [Tetrabaena socialis]
MTRAAPLPLSCGSLLFPVEIPGLEDPSCSQGNVACSLVSRSRSRTPTAPPTAALTTQCEVPPGCSQLLADVHALKRQCGAGADELARRLRAAGYQATCHAQDASRSAPGAMRLAHSFVVVKGCGPDPVVVDAGFRDNFSIGTAYATARYLQVLEAVPEVMIAPHAQLQELVTAICHEMKISFEATGSFLPPWRITGSVLSRWAAARAL